jgi:O-succinylbenzoic acid--CoA ligase
MNPFKSQEGICINGRLYAKKELLKAAMDSAQPAYLREVFGFAAKIFDKSKSIKVSTSGSTGKPKKMEFAKEAFHTSAKATNSFFELNGDSNALLALPMRYIAGKMMVTRAIAGGYNLDVLPPSSQPFAAGQGRYDFVPLTPFQANQCLEYATKSLIKTRAILIGGGPVSDELQRRLQQAGVRAYASFGMTETLSHFAIARLYDTEKQEVVYKTLRGVEIKIRKNGLLRVKWKGITQGWLDTNDLVARHGKPKSDGSNKAFTWLGRNDYLINSGGVKVIPELVEKRLAHLIHVPYFVAGIPHPKLGEEVALVIESEGLPARDLLSEVQHALSETAFWQPRKLLAISDFTYTPSGKIMRSATLSQALKKGN